MRSEARPQGMTAGKQRPFPWRCAECGREDVVPASTSYTGQVKYDGQLYSVNIQALEILTCRVCGERVFTNRVEESISQALRGQLHLLTPEQINRAIGLLGMEPDEVARRLGIHEDVLPAWIAGTVIQPRTDGQPASRLLCIAAGPGCVHGPRTGSGVRRAACAIRVRP